MEKGINFPRYNHYNRDVLPFFLKCMHEHNKNRGLCRTTSFVLSRVEEFRATYWVICALPRIYTLYSSNVEDGMKLAIERKSKRRKEAREREREKESVRIERDLLNRMVLKTQTSCCNVKLVWVCWLACNCRNIVNIVMSCLCDI